MHNRRSIIKINQEESHGFNNLDTTNNSWVYRVFNVGIYSEPVNVGESIPSLERSDGLELQQFCDNY